MQWPDAFLQVTVPTATNPAVDHSWSGEAGSGGTPGNPELLVDVFGFEGPLDLLLLLARNQKVDLTRISILALAKQYLVFIDRARALRLELAADYLVMAAWLAYLKSKLLVPKQPHDEGESGEELAAVLRLRLERLEAMRDAAARLANRSRLGRDVFARGAPEVVVESRSSYGASLYDLLTAYAIQRQRRAVDTVVIAERAVWSLKDAREILTRLIGHVGDWMALEGFLFPYVKTPKERATVLASSFAAALELVREGRFDLYQDQAFAPIYLRDSPRRGAAEPRL